MSCQALLGYVEAPTPFLMGARSAVGGIRTHATAATRPLQRVTVRTTLATEAGLAAAQLDTRHVLVVDLDTAALTWPVGGEPLAPLPCDPLPYLQPLVPLIRRCGAHVGRHL